MEEFSASLVREKIILVDGDPETKGGAGKESVIIRSNRVFLHLGKPAVDGKVVIRAQNMHTTLRFAAKVLSDYGRGADFDWEAQWDAALSDYEKTYNKEIWAAAYVNGKSVFKTINSPFVDVIEKCALLTLDNYDATMEVTEDALKKIGHAMRINHSSNVAAVFTDSGEQMRCGIIHRADNKDKTFSFSIAGGERDERIAKSFGLAAAYLDAFHLQFTVRDLRKKIARGEAKKVSPEASQIRAAIARQGAINRAIGAMEEKYEVNYRPARPDLFSEI